MCAEALAHGTPVLASNRGGIREYLDKDAGLLVDRNEASDWESALQLFYHHFILEDKAAKDKRAKVYQDRFSDQKIGRRYADILLEVIDDLHHGTPI